VLTLAATERAGQLHALLGIVDAPLWMTGRAQLA